MGAQPEEEGIILMKRILAALLITALLLALPAGALAAGKKARIRFPVKVGLMTEGATATLKPKLSGLSPEDVAWSSSDGNVLTMTGNVVSAVGAGRAIITAEGGGAKARCGVVVLPASVSVAAGQSFNLPRGGVEKYRIKDGDIASVSKRGVVTGKAAGRTKLLVACGRQKMILDVTVTGGASQDGSAPQTGSAAAQLDCASMTDQIVLVDYTGGSDATLSIHEKQGGVWKQLFMCPAYVGKNGIGKTVEGDKKTPVGTYNLTTPFGIKPDPGAKMDYTQVTKYHYWCGTSDSGYYNQFMDERITDRKHTSADEYLIEYGGVYNYCMFIDYNASGEPHKGSCIFLHCTGSHKYTAGCVAVAEDVMKKIIQWARPGVKIVVRQG